MLPEGRFRSAVVWYRNLSFLTLALIALPFMIDQARQSIYPQLEGSGHRAVPPYGVQVASKAVDRLQKKKSSKMESGDKPLAQEESAMESFSNRYPPRSCRDAVSSSASTQRPDPDRPRTACLDVEYGAPDLERSGGAGGDRETVFHPADRESILGFARIFLLVALTAGLILRVRSGPGFYAAARRRHSGLPHRRAAVFRTDGFRSCGGTARTRDA